MGTEDTEGKGGKRESRGMMGQGEKENREINNELSHISNSIIPY
jgi:hypothetical protein